MIIDDIKQYVEVSNELDVKALTHEQKIKTLTDLIDAEKASYKESIEKLTYKKNNLRSNIIVKGQEILDKITKIFEEKLDYYYPCAAAKNFDIIVERDNYDPDHDDSSGISTASNIENINDITSDYVKFFVTDTEYFSNRGYIYIPMKYFTTDIIDNDQYIADICKKFKEQEKEKERQSIQKEIDKLKAKLDELNQED